MLIRSRLTQLDIDRPSATDHHWHEPGRVPKCGCALRAQPFDLPVQGQKTVRPPLPTVPQAPTASAP